ncbi:MAG: hydrogenase maturation nickel metallochaperone HypA [Candidatus Aenigmatarchaeota archaeon]|nr:MAG: hydrogenase maturation nickel metallochaperone HypA [Candidatus Aenigmarchaeota archaeon]
MHDRSVAYSVSEEVKQKLEGKSPKKIEIVMSVGSLKFHDTTQVDFWIRELLQKEFGRELKVSTNIGTIDAIIKCDCGFKGKVYDIPVDEDLAHNGIFDLKCPKCSSPDEYNLVQGNEIVLKKISFS